MNKRNGQSVRQQRRLSKQIRKVASQVDSMSFFNLLTGPRLLEKLEALLPEYRERRYPPPVTLAMLLGQVLSADGSCQNAVDQALVNQLLRGLDASGANTGPYCDARARLPEELVRELAGEIGRLLSAQTPPSWKWRDRHIKLVDGTTILMPDTPENQAQYPQPESQKRGMGFPIARLVGVVSLANGAVLDVAMGPYQGKCTGEHALFRELVKCFTRGEVMIADSYYCSYFLIATLMEMGVDFVFEQHGARNTDFRTGEKLGRRDHRVSWSKPARPDWMSAVEYASFPTELIVREAKVRKNTGHLLLETARGVQTRARFIVRAALERWRVQ